MPPDLTPADAAASDRTRAAFAGLGWFVAFAGFLLAFAVAYDTLGVRYEVDDRPWFVPALHAAVWLSAAAALAWPASRPVGVRRTLALRGCTLAQLAAALLLAVALVPAVSLAAGVAGKYSGVPAAAADAFDGRTGAWGLLALLLGCVAPAVAEEVVFRGFIGRRLVTAYGTVGGVLATSLLFAATRLELSAAAGAFVLGLALHATFLATRSLVVPVTLHATANVLVAVTDHLALGRGYDLLGRDDNGLPAPALVYVASICAAGRTRWRIPGGWWDPAPLPAPLPAPGLGPTAQAAVPGVAPFAAAAVAAAVLAAVAAQVGNASRAFLAERVQPTTADPEWKPMLARRYREQGDALRHDGQPADAVAAYTRALEWAPDDAHALGNRGLAYADFDNAAAAERDLAEATRRLPAEVQYRRYLGWARMQLGRLDEALDDFDAVLKLVPDDDYALARRASALLKQRRWAEAAGEYDRAIPAAGPDGAELAELYAGRGKALSELGHYDQAVDDFRAALRREPKHTLATYELAWVRAACPQDGLRDGKAAAAAARDLCSQQRIAANLGLLAAALMECGERDAAIRTQEEALALATDGERDFFRKAMEGYRAGRPYRLSVTAP